MEARRKALGLRRQASDKNQHAKEEAQKQSKCAPNLVSKKSKSKCAANIASKKVLFPQDKEKDSSSTLSNVITSNQRTPKRRIRVFQSPYSPVMDSAFPRMLGSPEIEVSWDWGCSQIPKDMMPARLVKRNSPKEPPVVLSPLIHEPRVIVTRHMTEEENQARLAFYKNVLSQASKCKVETDSERNCEPNNSISLDNEYNKVHPILTTPKRSKKPFAEEIDKLSELFDDSANEFMLACSQVVEEQLKNGEINVGPIVIIQTPSKKHELSPDYLPEKIHKRVCHVKSKLNLFSEDPKGEDTNLKTNLKTNTIGDDRLITNGSFKPVGNNLKIDCNKSNLTPNKQNGLKSTTINQRQFTYRKNILANTKESARQGPSRVLLPEVPKQLEPKENISNNRYDSVDKFRRNSRGPLNSNQSQKGSNQSSKNVTEFSSSTVKENKMTNNILTNKAPETNKKSDDFTSLLDDEFDLELTSLDIDSICRDTEVPVVPKVCTKAEIEAKRLAALSRLKMKMKR